VGLHGQLGPLRIGNLIGQGGDAVADLTQLLGHLLDFLTRF
jgi:hypothetical protein